MTRVTQLIHDAGKYLLISVYPLPTHPTRVPGEHKAMWAGVPPLYCGPGKGKCGIKIGKQQETKFIIDSIISMFPYGNLANILVSSDIYSIRDSN